ncbi:unnamed protein product [Adineta steineri]|uniref:LicD/FKTN/FKRP nucleotidyltransferase domain-containing protein n=1 Tax=Adineta steineri TaxID=433720 RepID=A0A819LUK7_9BILA|nr:unnamed protein product [Adineta steineri]CAF3969449.1 unnamed protein product [Adineta steineri]
MKVFQLSKQKKIVKTINSPPSNISHCAFLTCSHSSQCTTQNQTCCAYILKHSLVFIDTFFKHHNLSYVIVYGTLLGAVRDKTIIPWTKDVDIGIFNKTYLFTKKIRDKLHQYGFHLFETLGLPRLCVHRYNSNTTFLATQDTRHKPPASISEVQVYIDLYSVSRINSSQTTSNTSLFSVQSSSSHRSLISFQNRVTIDEQTFPTIDNIEEHLIYLYTKEYMHDIG